MTTDRAAMLFLIAALLGFALMAVVLMPGRTDSEGLMVGMSEERVMLAWGPPPEVRRTVTTAGVREQWIYIDPCRTAFFNNGLLYSWED